MEAQVDRECLSLLGFRVLSMLIEFAIHERHNNYETKHDINEKDYI